MDTGDTGRETGPEDTHGEKEQEEIVSAAELAGETGGISCNTASTLSPMICLLAVFFILRRVS